jgi:hypothetical protein
MGKDLPGNDTYPFHVVRGADQDGRGEAQAFHHLSGFQCLYMGVFIIGRIIGPVNGRGQGHVKRGFDQFVVCHDQGAFEGRDQQKICISLFQQLPGLFSALRIVRSDEQDHGICMCRGFPAGQKRGRPQVGDGQTGKDELWGHDTKLFFLALFFIAFLYLTFPKQTQLLSIRVHQDPAGCFPL